MYYPRNKPVGSDYHGATPVCVRRKHLRLLLCRYTLYSGSAKIDFQHAVPTMGGLGSF